MGNWNFGKITVQTSDGICIDIVSDQEYATNKYYVFQHDLERIESELSNKRISGIPFKTLEKKNLIHVRKDNI